MVRVVTKYLKKIAHFLDNIDFFIKYFEYQVKGVPGHMKKKQDYALIISICTRRQGSS